MLSMSQSIDPWINLSINNFSLISSNWSIRSNVIHDFPKNRCRDGQTHSHTEEQTHKQLKHVANLEEMIDTIMFRPSNEKASQKTKESINKYKINENQRNS